MHLAADGLPRFTVEVRPGAPAAEEYAGEELRRHLHAMLGAGPQVRHRFHAAPHVLRINDREAAERAGIAVERHPAGVEEYLVETRGADLHILGGGPRGVLYGVYEFLEHLGCRWFTPEISRVPRCRTLRVGPLAMTGRPAFAYRDNMNWDTADPLWRVRNRLNGWHTPLPDYLGGQVTYAPGSFVHTHFGYLDPREHFADHPEYAAMTGGLRRPGANQLCLTNPEVLRIVTAAVIERMRQHPWATLFSVSQMDGGGYCECPACQAVVDEEGAQSGPILRFANAVAAETSKRFPDKLIDTLAYAYSVDAPRHVRPHPNVRVRLCSIGTCMAHPFAEACGQVNSGPFLKALTEWSRLTDQLHIWHYCTDFADSLLPLPDFNQIEGNLRLFRQHRAYGVFMQGLGDEGGRAESQQLRGWLIGRLLWNPDRPLWPLADEFLATVYGRAACGVRKYYDVFHALGKTGRPHHFSLGERPNSRLFDEDVAGPADAALAEAERTVRGAGRFRVRLLRDGLAYARLMRALPKAYARDGDRYAPGEPAEALRATADRLFRDWRKAGILHLSEGGPIGRHQAFIRRRTASHAVEWLRDGDGAVAVVPALNGRLLEWYAGGRQWLARALPDDFGFPAPAGYMEIPGHILEAYRCRRRSAGEVVLRAMTVEGLENTRRVTLIGGDASRNGADCTGGEVGRGRRYAASGPGAVMAPGAHLQASCLRIESRFVNRSGKVLRWSWGGRLFLLSPGPATVVFDCASGPRRLAWDELPAHERAFEAGELPPGQWRVEFAEFAITHRFSGQAFIRTTLMRDDARPGLALYVCTPILETAPGDGIVIEQEWHLEPREATAP